MDLNKIKELILLQNTNDKFALEKSIDTLLTIFGKISATKVFSIGEDLEAEGYRLDATLNDIQSIILDCFRFMGKLLT